MGRGFATGPHCRDRFARASASIEDRCRSNDQGKQQVGALPCGFRRSGPRQSSWTGNIYALFGPVESGRGVIQRPDPGCARRLWRTTLAVDQGTRATHRLMSPEPLISVRPDQRLNDGECEPNGSALSPLGDRGPAPAPYCPPRTFRSARRPTAGLEAIIRVIGCLLEQARQSRHLCVMSRLDIPRVPLHVWG